MNKKLTAKQRRALAALIDGASVQGAAQAAQVDRRTITRWLNEPHFLSIVRGAGDATLRASARRLAGNLDAATDAVSAVLGDSTAAASVRLRAAEIVLSHTPRLLETGDLVERLEALEQRIEAQERPRR